MTVPFPDLRSVTAPVRSAVLASWSALLDGDQFVGGASVERFESSWADYCGTARAVGTGSGADALHLTLRALRIGRGDEVVVPANAFVGVAEAVVLAGATPRFADVDPDTLLLSHQGFADAITQRTAAVIAVHLHGRMADMNALLDVATRSGVVVIEEATHAPGGIFHGRRAGSVSRAGCFGFHPEAALGALGDAGAVTTSDDALAAAIRALRNEDGTDPPAYTEVVGWASRLDSMQADVLNAKLALVDEWNEMRRAIAQRYRDAVDGSAVTFVGEVEGTRGTNHLAVVRLALRARARVLLQSLGVQTRIHYATPLHLLPAFAPYWTSPLPEAERAAQEILTLPMSPYLTPTQIDGVCHALQAVQQMLLAGDGWVG